MLPARKFQADTSMSVVANSEPLFQLCINCTVLLTDNMKMAAIMEDSGLCPCAPSTAAFKMKNAASTGTNRVSTTFETKLLKVVSILATQELLVAADCGGRTIPCAANQERN